MRILALLLLIGITFTNSFATDNIKGAPSKTSKGDCSASNKGNWNYYKTRTKIDANRDGFYDTVVIGHCNGATTKKKLLGSISILLEENPQVNINEVAADLALDMACSEVFDAVTGELVGVIYSAGAMLDENDEHYDCEIDFNGAFMNHYLEQYDGVTVNEAIVFQDPTTGVMIKHITMPVSGKFVGFEYTSTEGNTYRIFTMRYVAE